MIEITSIGQAEKLIAKYKFLCSPTMKEKGISWMVVFKDNQQDEPRKIIINFITKSRAVKIANSLNNALLESKKR